MKETAKPRLAPTPRGEGAEASERGTGQARRGPGSTRCTRVTEGYPADVTAYVWAWQEAAKPRGLSEDPRRGACLQRHFGGSSICPLSTLENVDIGKVSMEKAQT